MKKYLKKNKLIYQFLIYTREKLRIIYNTKTRSRYLWRLKNGDEKKIFNENKGLFFEL